MLTLFHVANTYKKYGYEVTNTSDVDIKICTKRNSDVAVILLNSLSNKFISAGIVEKVKTLASNPFVVAPKKYTLVVILMDNSRIKHERKIDGTVTIDVNTEKIYKKNICKQAEKELQILEESLSMQKNKAKREDILRNKDNLFIFKNFNTVYGIMAICILCFFLISNPNNFGISYDTVIKQAEWGRIATYMFMHGGFLHLFYNMISLLCVGRMTEKAYGSFVMLFVLFSGGFYGAIISIYGFMTDVITVGISGGLYALMGACLVIYYRNKKYLWYTIINLIFNTLMQMINPFNNVDYLCHIGGFVSGVLFMLCFVLLRKTILNIEYSKSTRLLNEKDQLKCGF